MQSGIGASSRFIPACAGNTLSGGTDSAMIRRFIPACAGNTRQSDNRTGRHTVHPRMRGEHGSAASRQRVFSRFIPACAGNTTAGSELHTPISGSSPHARGTHSRTLSAVAGCNAVHPRMRGEHTVRDCARGRRAGSSPHARGTRRQGVRLTLHVRFIPACAGNTSAAGAEPVAWTGSSPHARGTLFAESIDLLTIFDCQRTYRLRTLVLRRL